MIILYILKKDLFIHERPTERQRHRQREKQASRREPDVGLHTRAPGSCPKGKEDAQPLSHPGVPKITFYTFFTMF